jgi:RHS repeat-associated protein
MDSADLLRPFAVARVQSVPTQLSRKYKSKKINYTYNIRGWMTGINDSKDLKPTTERDLFAFKINYNTVENCVNYTGTPLYNGNISETYWRIASDNIARKYGYKYDNLNRLKSAIYQKANTVTPSLTTVTNKFDESLTYDKNGNIISLIRNGDPTDSNIAPTYPIDVLAYTYAPSTNRLLSVSETPASATSGFKDGNIIGDDYSYDANGNMTIDKNKGITAIVYNHLNLPTKITFGTTGNIVYIYNALGQKVQKQVYKSTQGSIPSATYYLGGFQYVFRENYADYVTKLQFIPTAEGYVKNTVVSGVNNYSYVFNYTDHLGNVRLSYQDLNKDGLVANSEILEESNYYPFGLKHSGYNSNNAQPNYKYKYNGKDLKEELGLNIYDYGARNYDPALGRWMNVDPLAEQMRRHSPYNYAFNNPLRFTDPDGMSPDDWIEYTTKEGKQSVTYDAEIKTKEQAEAKGYTDVKQVVSTANVTNNTNGDKIQLREDGTYRVNGGVPINAAEQSYTSEGGANINANQSALSQIAPIMQDLGDGLTVGGLAVSSTVIGAPAGAVMIGVGRGLSTTGTGLELIDNYNTGTLTPEKFATKAAMEIIPNVGENAFKALKTPGAAKVIESATIGADRALDAARNAKAGPYRN